MCRIVYNRRLAIWFDTEAGRVDQASSEDQQGVRYPGRAGEVRWLLFQHRLDWIYDDLDILRFNHHDLRRTRPTCLGEHG